MNNKEILILQIVYLIGLPITFLLLIKNGILSSKPQDQSINYLLVAIISFVTPIIIFAVIGTALYIGRFL